MRTKFILFACIAPVLATVSFSNYAVAQDQKVHVVGRINIETLSKLKMKRVRIHFNERLWGKYSALLDDSGYFNLQLPVGHNFLSLIEYLKAPFFFRNIPENRATINLESGVPAYYIGDIRISWTPGEDDVRNNRGIAGTSRETRTQEEALPLTVTADSSTIIHFLSTFPKMRTQLIAIEE